MLAHAGGAATIDAPVWLLAYGAAALVLLVTVTLRGRLVVAGADGGEADNLGRNDDVGDDLDVGVAAGHHDRRGDGPGGRPRGGDLEDEAAGRAGAIGVVVGHVVGMGLLTVVVTAALVGPSASAANLAPSAVLSLWWVGLPLACIVAGDVMAWLDPFGTVAGLLEQTARAPTGTERAGTGHTRPRRRAPAWTAAALLAVWAWWVLAYHDGRDPRAIGWFLVVYTVAAVAGAVVWGQPWLRQGEAFGALSSTLARARRLALHPATAPAPAPDMTAATAVTAVGALVAVWLGSTAFDLFSGTRAWVDLAAGSGGWARTARATGCLAAAVLLAASVMAVTVRLAASPTGSAVGATARVRKAVALAWSAATAGMVVGHGLPVLLLDGQFALALASDPFGQGWDLFGTARRTIDYSPLSPGLVGGAQIAAAAGGAAWGVVVAARVLRPEPRLGGRVALRALWVIGAVLAMAAAAGVAALSADLE